MSMRLLPLVLPFPISPQAIPTTDHNKLPGMGRSWQEQTFGLGALVIETTDTAIRSIRHIARRDVATLAANHNDRAGGTTYIELLGPGEWIRRIEFRYTPQDGVIGLRVQTMRRMTQWVGGARGIIDAVEAPTGFFINAIIGVRSADRCWPLGALSCPFSMVPKPEAVPRGLDSLRYGAGLHDGAQRAFRETAVDARAIVVRCDFHVLRVWVLSTVEYEQFETFRDRTPLGRDEFCLDLAPSEVVEWVEIQSHEVVNAIRICTSQREMPWWGRAAFGSIAKLDCRRDGKAFAGFHGTMGQHFVGSLGVVYGVIKEQ